MHLCRSSANAPRLPSVLEMLQNHHALFTFVQVHNPLRLPRKITSEPSKVVRACRVFNILTWKCASHHNRIHFFSISTFWLRNVLRATTACTFSTSQLPKVLRDHQFFTLLTLKCASRNNSVHFFDISRETQVFRDFPTFARTCIFFFLTLSLLWSSLFFSSLLFSDSSHLCFCNCPYCRKFDF